MNKEKYIAIGLTAMLFNSLYQYSWNALEPLFKKGFNVSIVEIEIAFTLFTIFSTTFQSVGGYFADTKGPRTVGIFSAILSALGFLGTSFSPTVYFFYIFWSLGSIGEGILYGIATNLAIKWYQDRRGFATGLVSLGFGVGASLTNPVIATFTNFREITLIIGLVELIILPVLLSFSKYPSKGLSGNAPKEIFVSSKWWLIYFSFVTAAVPLTVMSSSLSIIGRTLPLQYLVILISIFPFMSGVSRPILGHVSDKIGRAKTVLLVDVLITIGALLLTLNLIAPSVIIIGFFGGSMITLYFSLVGDIFGSKFSTSNNGFLYTGKAIAGIMGSVIFSYLFLTLPEVSKLYTLICGIAGTLLLFMAIPKKEILKIK
jgi:OFA family oxalate/formate antiporter-like MFS transporter